MSAYSFSSGVMAPEHLSLEKLLHINSPGRRVPGTFGGKVPDVTICQLLSIKVMTI